MNFLMKNKEINKQMIGIMNCLDSMTYNHSVRVMLISAEIEKHLGMKNHKLMYAAMFHDVGKMYIPFNILDKNIRLTKLERQIMDLHPYIGYTQSYHNLDLMRIYVGLFCIIMVFIR